MKNIIKIQTNEKIKKSKEIIKREKKKINEERKKQLEEKASKSKIANIIKKIVRPAKNIDKPISLKEQIFSMIYFEIIGAVLCLLILFALSGGKNYIKLYMDLSKLINVYDTINSNYYGELDKEALIDGAIKSMIDNVGDAYTTYTDDSENNALLDELQGTYEGIGCTVTMNEFGQIIVVDIFDDSPAKEAGLQSNDIITKIDEQDFSNRTSEEMANYIKSSSNSTIKLIITREEEEKELLIKRKKVEMPTVTSKIIEQDDKKVGYMDVSVFSAVTYNQFKKQLEQLEEKNIDGLIIDVRYDTGGYLSCVTDISSLFLKKGQVIYQLEDKSKKEKIKDNTKESREYPVAVLINGISASASEILASAIKESYGGIVIGTNSYGKGTVQKTKVLSDGSMIKYTTQNWLTPIGTWINEIGVEPTIEVDLDITSDKDNQLDIAVSEIIKKLN